MKINPLEEQLNSRETNLKEINNKMRPKTTSKNVIALEPMKQLIKAIQIFHNIETITYTDEAKLYIQCFLNNIISKHLENIDLIIINNKRSTLFASDLSLNESMFLKSVEITNNMPNTPYKLQSGPTVVDGVKNIVKQKKSKNKDLNKKVNKNLKKNKNLIIENLKN